MGKTLYLECYSGISGDMTVGALLDLGADQKLLEEQLRSLPVSGFEIKISRVKKSGLDACDFHVVLDEVHENHDHDNDYLYGHEHTHEAHGHTHGGHSHAHVHSHEAHTHEHLHEAHSHTHETQTHEHLHEAHEHTHEAHTHEHLHEAHGHTHGGHSHAHVHRGLREIREIILNSGITERAKRIAQDIFQVLAEAEAKAHGTTLEEVHFHEVGAVDSIVDIVAAAVCLDDLDVDEVIVPEVYEGRGTVRCQHGIIPVPVPAVVHIAGRHRIALHITNTEGELVTPTGAAIVAAVRTADRLPDKYKILRSGMGAGKRDYGRASVLRGMLIEAEAAERDSIYKLESNIDDCTGEVLGYVMEQLFAAGARDVSYIPIYMKKNRPAYQLDVICSEETVSEMEEIIFRETTTIGIRRARLERAVMRREILTVETSLGTAKVKVCRPGVSHAGALDGQIRVYPEYESVADICRDKRLPYQEVWRQVQMEACDQIK